MFQESFVVSLCILGVLSLWNKDFDSTEQLKAVFKIKQSNSSSQTREFGYSSAQHMTKDGKESTQPIIPDDVFKTTTFHDRYTISLSHKYQVAKSLSVTSSNNYDYSVLSLQTWMTNKERFEYPFTQVRSADIVMLTKEAAIRLMHFMFSGNQNHRFESEDITYSYTKHFEEQEEFPHVTILQVTRNNSAPEEEKKNIYSPYHMHRGIVLELKEYKNIINRISQIINDMDNIELPPQCKK